MASFFRASKTPSISAPANVKNLASGQRSHIMQTSYTSNPVQIPPNFLKEIPKDTNPITIERVNFAESALPEYAPYYATVLDNVLSASECAELLHLAALSSPTGDWAPALLNVGVGVEILETEVRHCDRIIWDDQEIVKRIWDRCLLAEGLGKDLERIEKQPGIQGELAADRGVKWKMVRANERMRFLKYGAGNYFRSQPQ